MTESVGRQELRHSTFQCVACGSGSENFLSLFENGTCARCGNPAGIVIETSHPEDVEKIEKSVIVVSAKEDEEKAKKIMKELSDEGISVIDPLIVSGNEKAGNRANVLAFLASKCKHVLVIPPTKGQFSSDPLVAAAVESAFIGGGKVVPLYPDKSYAGRSIMLDTIVGVVWEGQGERMIGKDRFLGHLKK